MRRIQSLLVVVGVVASAASVLALGPRNIEWFGNKQSAFLVLPPKQVTTDPVIASDFSKLGDYFLAVTKSGPPIDLTSLDFLFSSPAKEPQPETIDIVSWSRKTDAIKKMWSGTFTDLRLRQLDWIGSSGNALVVAQWPTKVEGALVERFGVLFLNCQKGTALPVPGFEDITDEFGVDVGISNEDTAYIHSESDPNFLFSNCIRWAFDRESDRCRIEAKRKDSLWGTPY